MHGTVDAGDELLERPFGSDAILRQLAAERGGDLLGPRVTHVPFGDRLEVPRGLARRQIDDLRYLGGVGSGHRRILPALGGAPFRPWTGMRG
jgi:hypothetical protein